uniref:Uncharacterized protein n=1 Tax=Rhizophora mucronata TaxID=61149 RepID=A0A2P2QWQ6_RHIMU
MCDTRGSNPQPSHEDQAEFEKIQHPSLEQLEVRRVACKINGQQRSRSPLGLAQRPISVGKS